MKTAYDSGANLWIKAGAECWVENFVETSKLLFDSLSDAFYPSIVISLMHGQNLAKVKYLGKGLNSDEVAIKYILQRDGHYGAAINVAQTVDNLTDLSIFNEAELLRQLSNRFLNRHIFTYVGDQLLVINPYQEISEQFTIHMATLYQKNLMANDATSLPPHIYATATNTFKAIFESEKHQSIIISGESGSGKTENTKFALKLLASLSHSVENKNSLLVTIEEQILQCNPILEAFGNAKTIRNDNSSRFGKLVTLVIDAASRKIEGAYFHSYLLEKSRVTGQAAEERNYHIFYALLRGLDRKQLNEFYLCEEEDQGVSYRQFNYLNNNPKAELDGDLSWFKQLSNAFKLLELSHFEESIYQILSAILLIGNIDFDEQTFDNNEPCSIVPEGIVAKVSVLLKVASSDLTKAFLFKSRVIHSAGLIDSPMNRADCLAQRDSMARDLYDTQFSWVIRRINLELGKHISQRKAYKLQILDIFGFEVLKNNSFEQLCINYANEKLQQLFIQTIYKKDFNEMKAEGLQVGQLVYLFIDNQPIIDLLDGYPMGIFHLLDENTQIAGTDESLASKIRTQCASHPNFMAPKLGRTNFIIKHSAREVEYNSLGFKLKNKDELGKNIIETLQKSKNPILSEQLNQQQQNDPKAKTLGGKFRNSIKELSEDLNSTNLHFIRCIKPNEKKRKNLFVEVYVLQQLRYLGISHKILQTGITDYIKKRKEGFPYKKPYQEFYKHYGEMEPLKYSYPQLVEGNADFRQLVMNMTIFKKVKGPDENWVGFLFGKTLLYLRTQTQDFINEHYLILMKLKHQCARKIQKRWYQFNQIRRFRNVRRGIRAVQRIFRIRREHKKFVKRRNAAIIIQTWFRRILLDRNRRFLRKHSMVLQKYMKRLGNMKQMVKKKHALYTIQHYIIWKAQVMKRKKYFMIKKLMKTNIFDKIWSSLRRKKATIIQRYWRGKLVRMHCRKQVEHLKKFRAQFKRRKAAMIIQNVIRTFIFRRRLLRMSRAARYIQGFMRMHWLQNLFQRIRLAVILIQRQIRKHLITTARPRKLLREFLLEEEPKLELYKSLESHLFDEELKRFCQTQFPTPLQKCWIYPLVISLQSFTDLSTVFEKSLSRSLFDFLRNQSRDGISVMNIQVGDAHIMCSTSVQKIYAWGFNDYFQLGRNQVKDTNLKLVNDLFTEKCSSAIPQAIQFQGRIKQIAAGSNHNLLLTYDDNAYAFGKNNNGEIGIPAAQNLSDPTFLSFYGITDYKEIHARLNQTLLITKSGQVQYNNSFQRYRRFVQPLALNKHLIISGSLGLNFAFLLTSNGQLLSIGNFQEGGSTSEPTIHLPNEKIAQVECGAQHVICRSTLGKVFAWGQGVQGQLGAGDLLSLNTPKMIHLQGKAIQVCAGMYCSVVLLESRKLFWWGTNDSLNYQNSPTQMAWESLVDWKENFPLKIESSWSRTMCIVYLKMIDMNNASMVGYSKTKISHSLALKAADSRQQDVPFIESVAKYFTNDVMENINFAKRSKVIIEQNILPQTLKAPILDRKNEGLMQEVLLYSHFEKWEHQSRIKVTEERLSELENYHTKNHGDDDLLVTNMEISPQKELDHLKKKDHFRNQKNRTPQTSSSQNKNQTQINISVEEQKKGKEQNYFIPPPNNYKEEDVQNKKLVPNRDNKGLLKDIKEDPRPPRPSVNSQLQKGLAKVVNSRLAIQEKSENPKTTEEPKSRSVTPTRQKHLKFQQNGEKQQAQMEKYDLEFLEHLQRGLKGMKLRMENLLKIPKKEWTIADHEFMRSVQSQKIRDELNQLK